MGTGSVVFAKTPTQLHRLGGWGYLFDNGFSGYAIARDGVMAALAAEDGTGEPTVLLDILQEKLGDGVFQSIPTLYGMPKEELAALAKDVFAAYAAGDRVAEQILQARAAALRHLIDCAADRFDVGTHVVLAGGLTRDREIVLSLLDTEHYTYEIPTLPPIYGACCYCARMLGEPPADFLESFEASYNKITKE
jgi:N-acetylglucosamine kinase-like BadF-type ATPase